MRTVTFKSVFDAIWTLKGHDPETITNINELPYKVVASLISRRVREGWEFALWPEWTLVEERTVETGGIISLQQQGLTKIGTVVDLYLNNPRTSTSPQSQTYQITEDGIQTDIDAAEEVFVEFRKRAPRFTTVSWGSGNTYQEGNLVFWPVVEEPQLYGNCYEAVLSAAGAFSWSLQEVPFVLEQWVIWSAFADLIMHNGERDRALQILKEVAYPELERAAQAELRQNGIAEQVRVRIGG